VSKHAYDTKERKGKEVFHKLDARRQGYLKKAERYAGFTLARLCLPENYNENDSELRHDWSSVGAQALNHAVNKLMLTMFAPSRPNIRLAMAAKDEAQLMQSLGLKREAVQEWLSEGEQEYVRTMDRLSLRPHVFDCLTALVGIGDSLMYLPRDNPDGALTYNIRDYVIRRTPGGKIAELVVRERVMFVDLEDDVKSLYTGKRDNIDAEPMWLYHHISRTGKTSLEEHTYLEDQKLPDKYSGTYEDEVSPWLAVTWHLAKGRHYGTGLVEEYAGAFSALSSLSKATVQGALLASEFRWLVNPNGLTKVEDFMSSENGAALPGQDGDITLVVNSKANDLALVDKVAEKHIRIIGQGFMMGSAMTRDAERVTAVEIRQQAIELETGLGGAFTRLAGTLQRGIAHFLLDAADLNIKGSKVRLSIITGLDALSRSGDLDALRAALQDVAGLQQLRDVIGELNLPAIISAIFTGHGLSASMYVKPEEQKQQEQAAAQEAQAQQVGTEAAAQASAQATRGQ